VAFWPEMVFWLEMAFFKWICLTSQSIERFGSPLMAESFQACLIAFEFIFHTFCKHYRWKTVFFYLILEINPCGLGSRIRDVEAFWYKTEIKIIYFVQLCLIACDCKIYPDPKLKTASFIFLRMEADFFCSYVITQGSCNKFIEVNFCVGCMIWRPNHL
jgi:hypothetical protein